MANTPAVVPIQVEPCIFDVSLSPADSALSVIGNAPNEDQYATPYGKNTSGGTWTATANPLTLGSGPAGDTLSGAEFLVTCVAGTNNGIQPTNMGFAQRFLTPPAGTLFSMTPITQQMIRFEMFGCRFTSTPTGTQCGKDNILTWIYGGMANGCIYDISQTGNGGQAYGWGLVYNTTAAQLVFVAKNTNGTGHALSAQVNVGNPANGITNPFYLDMRIIGATKSSPAAIQIFIDGVAVSLSAANSAWGVGTNLPTLGLGGTQSLGFIPVISNNTPSTDTASPVFRFTGARCRMGSTLSCLLTNQS